jgi:hypothetical protein
LSSLRQLRKDSCNNSTMGSKLQALAVILASFLFVALVALYQRSCAGAIAANPNSPSHSVVLASGRQRLLMSHRGASAKQKALGHKHAGEKNFGASLDSAVIRSLHGGGRAEAPRPLKSYYWEWIQEDYKPWREHGITKVSSLQEEGVLSPWLEGVLHTGDRVGICLSVCLQQCMM